MKHLILITFLSLVTYMDSIWALPPDFNALYDAYIGPAKGQLRSILISNKDDTYSYEMSTNAIGIWKVLADGKITEQSVFKKENDQLKPIKYNLDNSIKDFQSEANFNWEVNKIDGYYKERKIDLILEEKMIDRVLLQLDIINSIKDFQSEAIFNWEVNKIDGYYKERKIDLILEEKMIDRVLLQLDIINSIKENKNLTTLKILDKDKIENIEVELFSGIEIITVPFGKFNCVKVRHSKMGSDKENILWLAEDLDYIPVKLTQIESGETNFIAELKELNKKY